MGGVLLGLLVQVGFSPPSFLPTKRERGKEGDGEGKRGDAPSPCPIQIGQGGSLLPWPASSPPLWPNRPINLPGGFRQPPNTPKNPRSSSEPFQCPYITFQYMNLYLSTISRLLVMSVISSGTPNKLWSPKHKLIIQIV